MSGRNDDDRPEVLGVDTAPGRRAGTLPRQPCPEEIMRQLSCIVTSLRFQRSPLLKRILVFLIEAFVEQGDASALDATMIGQAALNKGPDYRSSGDSSVRVAMNRLRSALQLYYANEGSRDDIVITLEPGSYQPSIVFRASDEVDEGNNSLRLVQAYQNLMTGDAHALVMRAVKSDLKKRPEDARLLAALCDLCLDSYKFEFATVDHPVETATWAIERATSIDPNDETVLFQRGMFALLHQDLHEVVTIGEKMIEATNYGLEANLSGAFLLRHTPASDLANAIEQKVVGPAELPGWLNHSRFLAYYDLGYYEDALSAAIDFGMPHFFWGAIDRAASLAQLGLYDAAKFQLLRVVTLNPDFLKKPRWYLSQHTPNENTLAHVLEGLEKAGLGRLDL